MRALYPDWEGLARAVVAYVRMEAARKPDDPSSCGARRRPLYPRSRFPPVVGRHPRRLETTRHEDLQPPQWSAKSRSTGTHSPPTPSRISRSSSTRQSQGRLPNRRSETLRRGRPRRSIPPFMGLSRRDAGQRADNRLVKAHPCQLGIKERCGVCLVSADSGGGPGMPDGPGLCVGSTPAWTAPLIFEPRCLTVLGQCAC